MDINTKIAEELGIRKEQASAAVKLIDEGCTIPFIARYRKEATGALSDEILRNLYDRLVYLRNLEDKKQTVLASIEEQGKLTEELRAQILAAETQVAVDDLYRPYRPKRRTRATIAKEKGLEPLANLILLQKMTETPLEEAKNYINPEKEVSTAEDALNGAKDILAESVSDNADFRTHIRELTMKHGQLLSAAKDPEAESVYEMYYEFSESLSKLAGHRILAISRGEKEKFLIVKIDAPVDRILSYLDRKLITAPSAPTAAVLHEVTEDAYNRLIAPAIEREIRSDLFEKAEDGAIRVFGKNLEQLLMQPPIAGQVVLGWDPAFRTGCKLAVVDPTGKVLDTTVIYPTAPQNRVEEAKAVLKKLISKYHITLISLGNGTASRESEQIIVQLLKEIPEPVQYIIVNEAGASVYSASKLATEEFPQFDVGQRSAASMARRLQDPLAELVKIDPNGDTIYEAKDYIKNITSIKIDGQALGGKKANISEIAKTVFNENTGAVNFDAKVNNTAVFAKGDGGSYNVELTSSGFNDVTGTVTQDSGEYKYVYAGLTWEQYWASEGVYAAGDTTSSEELDGHKELDKGAFDTVTRATTNHGLHRGSFQTETTIVAEDGSRYPIATWVDQNTIKLTDGKTVGFKKGTITKADGTTVDMDHYEVYGLKYVPVAVRTEDYAAFCQKYNVVTNDGVLEGGYGEVQPVSYTHLTLPTIA